MNHFFTISFIISFLMLFQDCKIQQFEQKVPDYISPNLEFRVGDTNRAYVVNYNFQNQFSQDGFDFLELEILVKNVSKVPVLIDFKRTLVSHTNPNELKINEEATENPYDPVKPFAYAEAFEVCCTKLERVFIGSFGIFRSSFDAPTLSPGESIARTLYFYYPHDYSPNFIQFKSKLPGETVFQKLGPYKYEMF